MKNSYERFVRPLLFSLDPEIAHHLTIASLRGASHFPPALRAFKRPAPSAKPKTLFGLTFPNAIGLAAGLDKNGVAGIIATNTTLDHSSIQSQLDQEGGLSGTPLRVKATELVRNIVTNSKIPVIASGGICDAASAREKFDAGALLLQLYTGFVYGGPRLLREIMETM